MAPWRVDVDVPKTPAGHIVMLLVVLFGIRNIEIPADVLNVEWSKPRTKMIVAESISSERNGIEKLVVNADASPAEVRRIQKIGDRAALGIADRGHRQPFEHGRALGVDLDHSGRRSNAGIPGGDGPVFRCEDEDSRLGGSEFKIGGPIENLARGSAGRVLL